MKYSDIIFKSLEIKRHIILQNLIIFMIILAGVTIISTMYSNTAYAAKIVSLSDQLITRQGTKIPVTLKANGTDNTFIFPSLPKNGTLSGKAPNLFYTPNLNFHGLDSFTFFANNLSTRSNVATINILVNPPPKPIISDPAIQSIAAFSISFLIVIAILLVARHMIVHFNPSPGSEGQVRKFSDIIRTPDWDPSLSIFQFLLWTIVVLFSFFAIYLLRIFGGVSDPPQGGVPTNILALMGISVAVPIVSNYITKAKQILPPQNRVSLSAMLYEYDKPSLSRFQMFAWTWIGIIVYLFVLFSSVNKSLDQVQNLVLPTVDPTLVMLMLLSQVAFVGGKITTNPAFEVDDIQIKGGASGGPIAITLGGVNLDTKNKLTFSIVDAPKQGSLSAPVQLGSSSTITYSPSSGFKGTDFFKYKATDSKGNDSNTATVSISS